MVVNQYIKCKICGATIRLRIQYGYRDISFQFFCPDCNTKIRGEIIIKTDKNHQTWFENAERYHSKESFAKYVQELSAEFLQKKISKDVETKNQVDFETPFLRTMRLLGEEGIDRHNELENNLNRYLFYKNDLILMEDLFNNGKIDLLKNKIKNKEFKLINMLCDIMQKDFNFEIKNETDLLIIIHQARNILITNLLNLTDKDIIFKMPKKHEEDIMPMISKVLPFLNYFGVNNKFRTFEKRMIEVTRTYMDIIPLLLPILTAKDFYRKELILNEYIISYEPLYELTSLYQKIYELFCDGIDLIIGLNNIYHRGNYELFCKQFKITGFEDIINTYSSKYKKYSELLLFCEHFSAQFIGKIHNKIRNAEGHFNRDLDIAANEIIFKDDHKGTSNEIKIDYIEFASSIVTLYNSLNILFEYYYQMEKFYLVLIKGIKNNYGLKN